MCGEGGGNGRKVKGGEGDEVGGDLWHRLPGAGPSKVLSEPLNHFTHLTLVQSGRSCKVVGW